MRGTTTSEAKGRKVVHEMRTRFVDCIHVLQAVPSFTVPNEFGPQLYYITGRRDLHQGHLDPGSQFIRPAWLRAPMMYLKETRTEGYEELVHTHKNPTHRSPTQIGIGH